jgi:regulator of cell morphogenesis and NO signaling
MDPLNGGKNMSISATSTVKELAIEVPGATRVFDKLGIDYCCGGGKTLGDACAAAGLESDEVVRRLEAASQVKSETAERKKWPEQSLAALIDFIINKHHVFTTQELDRVHVLLAKVRSVHAERHPELLKIEGLFNSLKADLTLHMKKEEMILFPYIIELEEAVSSGKRPPSPMFGTVKNPVRMMRMEHDTAGEILRDIRQLSSDFAVPADACISFQTLYEAMAALEQDLHQHIHLENNVLFPRAEAIGDQ